MQEEQLTRFNEFRKLCLVNAETALGSAELLAGKKANHIVFHLAVLSLEEIGKIFIGWYHTSKQDHWNKPAVNIPFDDHVKKLFYAIWMPSFAKEKIDKTQIDEHQGMATLLHKKRLTTLYTDFADIKPLSEKISDEEAEAMIRFVRARLNLALVEGEVDTEVTTPSPQMQWFMEVSDEPAKRNFIFGETSQSKLVELGDTDIWIAWLQDHFEKEEKELISLTEKEIERIVPTDIDKVVDKWKLKIKIYTHSHSVRVNVLNAFNSKNPSIQLFKGGDNHTLFIEFKIGDHIPVTELWGYGWLTSKLFVAALNIGTNGLFYWNTQIDTEKYYEKITDLSNNHALDIRLVSGLNLNWSEQKMSLTEQELYLSDMVFTYFISITDLTSTKAVNEYLLALGLLAKNDIHSRFETEIFMRFYNAFRLSVLQHQEIPEDSNWHTVAYTQIEKMLNTDKEFFKIMAMAETIETNQQKQPVALTEIIGLKQYCGVYFLTLAVRKQRNDNTLRLTVEK